MSSFYLNEGWYSSEQLAEVLEANKILNNHLAKAIGELPESYTLTTHKVNPESLEGAAGSVVAMTQDRNTKVKEWVGLTYEEQEKLVELSHSIRDAINRTDWKLKEKNA